MQIHAIFNLVLWFLSQELVRKQAKCSGQNVQSLQPVSSDTMFEGEPGHQQKYLPDQPLGSTDSMQESK